MLSGTAIGNVDGAGVGDAGSSGALGNTVTVSWASPSGAVTASPCGGSPTLRRRHHHRPRQRRHRTGERDVGCAGRVERQRRDAAGHDGFGGVDDDRGRFLLQHGIDVDLDDTAGLHSLRSEVSGRERPSFVMTVNENEASSGPGSATTICRAPSPPINPGTVWVVAGAAVRGSQSVPRVAPFAAS